MGLQLAEPGFHTRCYVEWGKHPQEVIAAGQRAGYLAPAPVWDDVTTFDGKPWRGAIDTVLAGYPCQPFSSAGKRQGADDERHLWPDVARIVGEVRPRWVFLENVAGHISLGLDAVLRDLEGLGYTAAIGLFSADEIGSPHKRLRVFIVANTDEPASRHRQQLVDPKGYGRHEGRAGPEIWLGRDAAPASAGGAMADPGRAELERQFGSQRDTGGWQEPDGYPALSGGTRLHPPGPDDLAGWAAVLAARPDLAPALGFDDCLAWARRLAADPEGPIAAEAKPALCRMAHGLAVRSRSLHLLGNGVHPLAAGHAWRTLALAHGLGPADMG